MSWRKRVFKTVQRVEFSDGTVSETPSSFRFKQGKYRANNKEPNKIKKIALFPGQGIQKVGMASPYLTDSIFIKKVDECADAFNRMGGSFHLGKAMQTCQNVDDTRRAQPLLFAMQSGIMEMKISDGTKFDYAIGHSLGDITAAYFGGKITLDEAMLIIIHRADVLETAKGSMAVAMTDATKVSNCLKKYNFDQGAVNYKNHISIAGCNTPSMTTIAGGDVTDIIQVLKSNKIATKKVPVRYAFHSPIVSKDLITSLYQGLMSGSLPKEGPQKGAVGTPFYIPTGVLRESELLHKNHLSVLESHIKNNDYRASYWSRQIRHPVGFCQAAQLAAKFCGGPEYVAFEEMSHEPLLSRFMDKMGFSSNAAVLTTTRQPCNVTRSGISDAFGERERVNAAITQSQTVTQPVDDPLVNRNAYDSTKEGVPPLLH